MNYLLNEYYNLTKIRNMQNKIRKTKINIKQLFPKCKNKKNNNYIKYII